jgi:GNAT superfamily N-acetyltransferase
MTDYFIRSVRPGDEDTILALLAELAEYEKLTDKFQITREVIVRDYLGPQPLLQCELAFEREAPVGVATWYWTYGSFAASRGIYLEDLYVRPAFRGRGYGKAFLSVLDWHKPSIDFYDSLGA